VKLASKAIKLAGSEQQQLLQDEQQFVGRQGHSRSVSQSETISANIDLIAKLRRQLEERDAEIASLKVFTPLLSGHFHWKCKAHISCLHLSWFVAASGGKPIASVCPADSAASASWVFCIDEHGIQCQLSEKSESVWLAVHVP